MLSSPYFEYVDWYKPTEISRQFVNIAYQGGWGAPKGIKGRPEGVEGVPEGVEGGPEGVKGDLRGQVGTWEGWGGPEGQREDLMGSREDLRGQRKDLKGLREDLRWSGGTWGFMSTQLDDMKWLWNDCAMITQWLRNFDMKWN